MNKLIRRVIAELAWYWAFTTSRIGRSIGNLLGFLLGPFLAYFIRGFEEGLTSHDSATEYLKYAKKAADYKRSKKQD